MSVADHDRRPGGFGVPASRWRGLSVAAFLSFAMHAAAILLVWQFVPLLREFEPYEPTPIPVEIVVAQTEPEPEPEPEP